MKGPVYKLTVLDPDEYVICGECAPGIYDISKMPREFAFADWMRIGSGWMCWMCHQEKPWSAKAYVTALRRN